MIYDKTSKIRLYEETFLLVDTYKEKVYDIPFLVDSNVGFQFDTESFTWRSYNAAETLPTTRRVELINKYDFIEAVLNKNSETFVVHITALEVLDTAIHPSWVPLPAVIYQYKALIKIPPEYNNYANVYSPNLAIELP